MSPDQHQALNNSSGVSALFLSHVFEQNANEVTPPPYESVGADAPPPYTSAFPAAPPSAPAAPPPSGSAASDGTRIPQPGDTRPPGDTRSADQIINSNPTLKNLGNQSNVEGNLKKQVGDWTDPKLSPDQRADAAYRASEVITFVKTCNASDGSKRSDDVTKDGKIDGFTKDGQARDGTEAGLLQNFGKSGYSALQTSNHNLSKTNDSYVNKDGTTQSTVKHEDKEALNGLKKFAKGLLKVVKVFENVASKIAGFVADLKIPGISQLAGAASVGAEALSQAANVGQTALEGGDVKGAAKQLGVQVGETALNALTAPGAGKALGEGVKGITDLAARSAKEGGKQVASEGAQDSASDMKAKAKQGSEKGALQRG